MFKSLRNYSVAALVFSAAAVSAHEPALSATPMPATVQDIAPAAVEAVKVVDAFAAAIKGVRIADAGNLLDPKALILESGGSERSRDEYLDSHAIADAAFMQGAKSQLRYRHADADGNMAWVGSESTLETKEDGKPVVLLSTETMVLRNGPAGWRIVHIHWSSRTGNAGAHAADANPATDANPPAGSTASAPMSSNPINGLTVAGWYAKGNFQPCAGAAFPIDDAAGIERRIKSAGMSTDDPVYVRLQGRSEGSVFRVIRVEQVGSPTPVRDCPMTGTHRQGG